MEQNQTKQEATIKTVDKTMGEEIMRVSFSANPIVSEIKQEFANLFDKITTIAMSAENAANTPPTIHSEETIKRHMETVRKAQDTMRCCAKACELLELGCMYAVKGITV